MTAAAADFDGDGWLDIYVACDSTASILYRNNHDGTFTDMAVESGVAYGENGTQQAGMGLARRRLQRRRPARPAQDALRRRHAGAVPESRQRAVRGRRRRERASACRTATSSGAPACPTSTTTAAPDLVYVTGNVYPEVEALLTQYPHRGPRVVFRNVDGARFEDVSAASGPGAATPHSSRGAAFGDFDNDGDVDVLVFNMNEPPSLLRNDYAGRNGWIAVKLEGTRSNRAALGAIVRVTAGGRTQARAVLSQSSYYSHDDLRLHFGLGGVNPRRHRSRCAGRAGARETVQRRRGRPGGDDQGRRRPSARR